MATCIDSVDEDRVVIDSVALEISVIPFLFVYPTRVQHSAMVGAPILQFCHTRTERNRVIIHIFQATIKFVHSLFLSDDPSVIPSHQTPDTRQRKISCNLLLMHCQVQQRRSMRKLQHFGSVRPLDYRIFTESASKNPPG